MYFYPSIAGKHAFKMLLAVSLFKLNQLIKKFSRALTKNCSIAKQANHKIHSTALSLKLTSSTITTFFKDKEIL